MRGFNHPGHLTGIDTLFLMNADRAVALDGFDGIFAKRLLADVSLNGNYIHQVEKARTI